MTALLTFLARLPWQIKVSIAVAVCLAGFWAALSYQTARADRAEAQGRQSRVVVDALDTVATQTPIIRSEQEEKQRAVDQIQGADQRLPDGFGRELERVRQQRSADPR